MTKNKTDWINIFEIIIVSAALIAVILLFQQTRKPQKNKPFVLVDTVYKLDTVVITKKPIHIKTKPKIIVIKDTIIKTKPFIAKIDTVTIRDTISITYKYPENQFELYQKPKPDTILNKNLILYTAPITEKSQWWQKPLEIATSIALGILVGRATK